MVWVLVSESQFEVQISEVVEETVEDNSPLHHYLQVEDREVGL